MRLRPYARHFDYDPVGLRSGSLLDRSWLSGAQRSRSPEDCPVAYAAAPLRKALRLCGCAPTLRELIGQKLAERSAAQSKPRGLPRRLCGCAPTQGTSTMRLRPYAQGAYWTEAG